MRRVTAGVLSLLAACTSAPVAGPADGVRPPTEPVRVVAAGDIASGGSGDSRTSDLVLALDPDHVLTLGDNAYPRGSVADFRSYYAPTWGRFKAITMPAPGNHEWLTPDAAGYQSYFGSSFPVAELVGYQSLVPGWDIYQIDTERNLEEQIRELNGFLQVSGDACQLVYGHHPRWSSAPPEGRSVRIHPLWDVLVANDVELYVSGHGHNYERFAPMDADGNVMPDGTRQIVAGTGGAESEPFVNVSRASRKRLTGSENLGVLVLVLHGDAYRARFHRATGGTGTVADRFSAHCA